MKRIFVPTRSGSEWQRLLAMPNLHWKKGASAMTAAACWEASDVALPREISTLLDSSNVIELDGLELLAAFPEWQTPLEGGKTPTHTDVLAVCRNEVGLCVISVEAKADEYFGPLVSSKRKQASGGQLARLASLKTLLGLESGIDPLRYQLLHRTASAILTARSFHARTAVMLVQSFGQKPSIRRDFDRLCDFLAALEITAGVYSVRTVDGPALYLVWCNGDPQFLEVELPSALS